MKSESHDFSGSSNAGAWAKSEYMPILFRSCIGLGAVPNDLPVSFTISSPLTDLNALVNSLDTR